MGLWKTKRFVLCFCALPCIAAFAAGQDIPADKILHYGEVILSLDAASCPRHEIAIDNDTLAAAFRIAMTYYPELCGRKIQVQYGCIKTSMAAQPRMGSVFRKRDKRTYRVLINRNLQKAQARLVYAAPFDARVGVMGHELAHILDYSSKSGWQMVWTGIRYLGKKYRRTMERQTDSVAITRGFGWQLYHYAYFVIHEAVIDDAYRRYKLDMYLKPEEILEIVRSQTGK
ncbi:MAG: hypothetical protein LBL04_02820 [Bacteroidales bacterium]|nr:hypothetical protein [Bacteroidales bacterium]